MNKGLYRKMALMNIKKSGRYYSPFLMTIILTVAMFFNMCSISMNETIVKNQEGATYYIMNMGVVVVGIFAAIFLFYTNSFLMKRRNRELGLYYILGLEKRHIGKILTWETMILAAAGIVAGFVTGMLMDRLFYLVLLRLFRYPVDADYRFSVQALIQTILVFGAIFLLMLASNIMRIRRSKAVELLSSENVGEREPKTRWLLAAAGIACVGYGYYLAITTTYSLDVINIFFEAVLLVFAGTYLLFLAGSIALLKLLKKNKKYYYQTKHFVSVSGMIYRMKRNAIGLANICVLSTGVLLVISTTVSLYMGMQDILSYRFPADIGIKANNCTLEQQEEIQKIVARTAEETGYTIDMRIPYSEMERLLVFENGIFRDINSDKDTVDQCIYVELMTAQDYGKLINSQVILKENEALIRDKRNVIGEKFRILGKEFTVKENLSDTSFTTDSANAYVFQSFSDTILIIVSNDQILQQMCQYQNEENSQYPLLLQYHVNVDVNGSDEEILQFSQRLNQELEPVRSMEGTDEFFTLIQECRQENTADFYHLYGSLLFLGIFLGILFLMATILIIYYKQMMEGLEDQQRYTILRKVGMNDNDVKRTVKNQIVTLFFLPLGIAIIHMAAAFPLMTDILHTLNLMNQILFLKCTICTILIFSAAYAVIYQLTARMYYKIVS